MVVIEDELHADQIGQFATRAEAMAELQRLATIAWDAPPNRAPCTSWRTCGRAYELVEFDDGAVPWRETSRAMMLTVSHEGVAWGAAPAS